MKRLISLNLFVIICLVFGSISLSGCNLLNVENPNDLIESNLDDPTAAVPMANGAEASLTRAMADIIGPISVASDEFMWIGSRDDWQQIDQGNFNDPLNEYNNRIYEYVAEARWVTDEYIDRLEEFKTEGKLSSNRPLIRVYLYGAIAQIVIADNYDNFVFSNRQEAGQPIGEANMQGLYDTAIEYINKALALSPENDLSAILLGLRARAKYSKGLWGKINPVNDVNINDPLVNSSEAAADADAALALMSPDYQYQLVLNPSLDDLIPFDQALADQTNTRLELRIGDRYVEPTEDGQRVDSVILRDPIDDVVQPFLENTINEFTAAQEYANITIVSAREMHLIKAETALAQNNSNNNSEFTTPINTLRQMDGLTPYNGQIPAIEMLEHARQVYLFLQGRRLADQYRFQISSPLWLPQSTAAQNPGTFFPIPNVEIQANPNI